MLKKLVSITAAFLTAFSTIPYSASPAGAETTAFPYTIFAASAVEPAVSIQADYGCVNGKIAANGTVQKNASWLNLNGTVTEYAEQEMIYVLRKLNETYFQTESVVLSDTDYSENRTNLAVRNPLNVTLDMNSYTLSRGLTEAKKDGSVIYVYGTLEITGGGVITGGNTTGLGGGVWVRTKDSCGSSVTLRSGAISGNQSGDGGGGVYVSGSDTSFTLAGGTVANNNTAKNGGGIAFSEGTNISIQSGSITGNTALINGGGIWFSGKDYESQIHSVTGGSITDNIAAREWDYMKMRVLIALTNRSFRCYNRAKKHAEGTDSHAIQNQKQPLAAGLAARIFYGLSR